MRPAPDMQAHAFYKATTMDEADLFGQLLQRLQQLGIAYCVVGGQGVNAYVEPLVSLDLDLVVAAEDADRLVRALPATVRVERFAHSVNLSAPGSDLRVQIQTDPRYAAFPARATTRTVLGTPMRVAAPGDILDGKIWAASDPNRRPSKRQKDLADIARLIEHAPELRAHVPQAILDKLV